MAYGAADVSPDVIREGAIVCLAGADPFAELCVAGGESVPEAGAAFRRRGRSEKGIEALPFGGEVLVFAGELAPDGAEGAGGDARVETARALEVRDDFGVQEMFDGGEEFVVGGSVLHGSCLLSAIRYQLSVLRGRRDSSLLATNEGLGAG